MGKGPAFISDRKKIHTADGSWMNVPHGKIDLGPRPLDCLVGK